MNKGPSGPLSFQCCRVSVRRADSSSTTRDGPVVPSGDSNAVQVQVAISPSRGATRANSFPATVTLSVALRLASSLRATMPGMKPRLALALAAMLAATAWSAWATSPAELTAQYAQAAQRPAVAAQGEAFFKTRHGREWSCASCHGAPPTRPGQHRSTGKVIAPLAPALEPGRFTDAAKTEKWFRRNCNDVLGRECSPGEKADVLAWLSSLKP